MPLLPLALLLVGCHVEGGREIPIPPVIFEFNGPAYGEFLGSAPARVSGRLIPLEAELWVQGQAVKRTDTAFTFDIPVDGAYEIVDVEAVHGEYRQRYRIPVFSGRPPAETWPGGLSARLLPEGLTRIGENLGAMIDDTGWSYSIQDMLPEVNGQYVSLIPDGITHDPTVVVLTPAVGGIDTLVSLRNVMLNYVLVVEIIKGKPWEVPITIGFGEIGIGAVAVPAIDAKGMITLTLTETNIVLSEAELNAGKLEGWILEWLADIVNEYVVAPLGEALLDYVVEQFGTFTLGGPVAFQQDLMGLSLQGELQTILSDLEGVAAIIALGIGEPLKDLPLDMPVPGTLDATGAQAVIGLHEYLLDEAISSAVLPLLTQDLELGGVFGKVIGASVANLPGGDEVPDGDGFCLSIDPGTARVVRLQEGIAPLVVLYAPDTNFKLEVLDGESCDDWLEASLALEVGLKVEDGTRLGFDIQVPEGAIIEYGATDYDEQEVIAGIGTLIGSLTSLLGGMASLDLADLMGGLGKDSPLGAFGDLSLSIVDSQPMTGIEGIPIEGLYAVSLDLFENPKDKP